MAVVWPQRLAEGGAKLKKQDEKKLLNTLKSIDGTLKRIEQSLSAENRYSVIKEAVSHAVMGEKYGSTPKDDS